MVNKKDCKVVVLKRSCLTGRIVWAYRGDEEGARKAYWRACKKEVRRVRNWMKRMANRRRQLLRIITPRRQHFGEQLHAEEHESSSNGRQHARSYQLAKKEPPLDRAFYDHIIEEAKRRNWQSGRWKENREKMIRYGQTHTACEYQPKKKKQ